MNGDDVESRVDPFSTVRKMPGSKPSQIVACFGSKDSNLYCFFNNVLNYLLDHVVALNGSPAA